MATRKQKISEYREKMDKTLASNELINIESIKTLVKRQFLLSSQSQSEETNEVVLEKRSMEVKNFLDMMRSASGDHHHNNKSDWKVKEDNDAYRVMYREGPEGTPFHILLVEGYADAPMDVCLCAAWETTLYKKWWPQITIPTFKILADSCLQKIRIGEHLSLVRMKVTWPLSAREVIVHYFELEYLQDDMIIGLLTTVPDTDNIKKDTHGFSNEGIPKAKDIVRMDFIGGTAMKKLSGNKTYYRTIGSMDVKLDLVPTWLINFMARQLMGGACKLYQKTVASVTKDKDFEEALKDPLYVRIREGLSSSKKLKNHSELKAIESTTKSTVVLSEQHEIEEIEPDSDSERFVEVEKIEPESGLKGYEKETVQFSTAQAIEQHESTTKSTVVLSEKHEIEEIEPDSDSERFVEVEKIEPESGLKGNEKERIQFSTAQAIEQCHDIDNKEKKVFISAEVKEALGTLDSFIDMFQKGELSKETGFRYESTNKEILDLEPVVAKVASTSLAGGASEMDNISKGLTEATNDSDVHSFRFTIPYLSREVNRNRIAPAFPIQNNVILTKSQNFNLTSSQDSEEVTTEVIATNESNVDCGRENLRPKKKWRYSCLRIT